MQHAAGFCSRLLDRPLLPLRLGGAGEGERGFSGFSDGAGAAVSEVEGLLLGSRCRNLHLSPRVHLPFFQNVQTALIFLPPLLGLSVLGDCDQAL